MVRFVKILGVLFILGFFLWALMPGYNDIVEIMHNTTENMTALESAGAKLLLPVILPAVIIIAVIWHHFSHKEGSSGGDE